MPIPVLIFTTAFDQYAVDSYRVNALDYLLKPISYPDFLASANKALRWYELLRKPVSSEEKGRICANCGEGRDGEYFRQE